MTNLASSVASSTRRRTLAYWVTTLVLATECVVGGVMGALRLPPFIGGIRHLGYPAYLMTILGVWYVLAGVALAVPNFPRLKEWAYAGLVFTYAGAAASRLAVADGAEMLVAPIIFTGLVAVSWALRLSDRRDLAPSSPMIISAGSSRSGSIAYWVTTLLVAAEALAASTIVPYDHGALGLPELFHGHTRRLEGTRRHGTARPALSAA